MTETTCMSPSLMHIVFLICAVGFFVCLKLLASPKTARLGNALGALAMLLAVVVTFVAEKPDNPSFVLVAMALGSVVGVVFAKKVEMTAMPQLVALFNGLGGLASVFVPVAETIRLAHEHAMVGSLYSVTSWFSVMVGAITFTGSVVAYLKLQEIMPSRPIMAAGQRTVSLALVALTFVTLFLLIQTPEDVWVMSGLSVVSAVLGVLLVIPIGGADMPVVISLLNSYSGLAALAAGFVINSPILIISGALVGASGIILTRLMCRAMNRSLMNVVFGAFGNRKTVVAEAEAKSMREFLPSDAAMLLKNARKVIIVPGYGLAVSQAQGSIRDLANALKAADISVSYAIHPVAGRMPGHMNVLLAEADIPYDELFDLDAINGEFETTDVSLIVGANDVVNPQARTEKSSPLYGMPILNADKSGSVIVLKRGRGRGFAGVENPLFTLDKAGVVFGDAKESLVAIINALKEV